MPKTQLNPSPLAVHGHHFPRIDITASPGENFGFGTLEVNRTARLYPDDGQKWILDLEVLIAATNGTENPPPYVGSLQVRGFFEVHPNYPDDPGRLINVTAASILYGAAREMLANFTARSANGMITLPSVSFAEPPEKKEKKKTPSQPPGKAGAGKAKRKTGKLRT